jgi:Cysteine sulfinate desulfinase/cysteine desulfurase and related enzymes
MFRRTYLDNSATTAIDPEVLEAIMPYLTGKFGNASSIHHFGQETRSAVDKARHQVAALLNARPNEIVFTSGGTESNNLAIKGLIESRVSSMSVSSPTVREGSSPKPHIITSSIEHPAVKEVCADLEKSGCEVTYLPVYENGLVRFDDLKDAIRENTVLITIMTANNEIGTLQPVEEIGKFVRELRSNGQKIWFHTDAVQAVGKMRVDVEEIGCDMLSISAHKIHAPKGIGALYVRRGTRLHAQNIGGRQERGIRGGTEPVAQIVALGKAAELAGQRQDETAANLLRLRDDMEQRVFENIQGAYLNGDRDNRLPNISNISFSGIEGEGLLINLDMQGVAVSTGSACSSGSLEPSPVIRALGRAEELARGAIRFSLSKDNTAQDIDRLLEVLPGSVENLRRLAPNTHF